MDTRCFFEPLSLCCACLHCVVPCPVSDACLVRMLSEGEYIVYTLIYEQTLFLPFLALVFAVARYIDVSYTSQKSWKNARKFGQESGSKNTTNIGCNVLGTCRLRLLGRLGRNFPCYRQFLKSSL